MTQRAAVLWPPGSEYTISAIRRAFNRILPSLDIVTEPYEGSVDVQFSDFDEIDWDAVKQDRLVSAYAIRKALTRKHHLALTIAHYLAKHPNSSLATALPETYSFELAFADELDELWADELYHLKQALDEGKVWWILKPGMAEKGQGIRIFNSQEQLEHIMAEFEEADDDNKEVDDTSSVALSHMRWWVVQRYIERPLLIDRRKFHLRAYVLAVGALTVYLHTDMLALFATEPYSEPCPDADKLGSHLTNTCLQKSGEVDFTPVRRFNDLPIALQHRTEAIDRIADIVGETWRAALGAPTSFQPLPNAFEIYGVDLLLDEMRMPHLLEINAGPDFKQTGAELVAVIDHLFEATVRCAVAPRLSGAALPEWHTGTEQWGLRKVLDVRCFA